MKLRIRCRRACARALSRRPKFLLVFAWAAFAFGTLGSTATLHAQAAEPPAVDDGEEDQSLDAQSPANSTHASPEPKRWSFELPGPVGTPSAEATKEASTIEAAARTAFDKKEWQTAFDHFAKAYVLSGSASALEGAAKGQEELKDLAKAHGLVSQLLRIDERAKDKDREARQEWLTRLEQQTSELRVDVSKPARVVVDDVVWLESEDLARAVVGRVMPGKHDVVVSRRKFKDVQKSVDVSAGASEHLKVRLKRIKKKKPLPPAVPLPPGGHAAAEVKDFCRISLAKSPLKFQRQKLVLFDLAGEEITNSGEDVVSDKGEVIGKRNAFRQANVHGHLRTVFFSVFPTNRFHIVKAQTKSPESFRGRASVSAPDMIRAAERDAFAAYSIACSDWVAMPRVVEKRAAWRQVQKQKHVHRRSVSYAAWDLSVDWQLELDVYRRDGSTWVRLPTLKAGNDMLTNLTSGTAGAAQQVSDGLRALKGGEKPLPMLSDRPSPECKIPVVGPLQKLLSDVNKCSTTVTQPMEAIESVTDKGAQAVEQGLDRTLAGDPNVDRTGKGLKDAVTSSYQHCADVVDHLADARQDVENLMVGDIGNIAGLAGCLGIGASFDLPPEAVAPGSGQLRTGFCKAIDKHHKDDAALGDQALVSVATCTGRLQMDRATLLLQKEAHRMKGWRIRALLADGPSLPIGEHEGAERGDVYRAVDAEDEFTGPWGRLMSRGPGGDRGEASPSAFKFRRGDAQVGTPMVEYALVGITFGLQAQGGHFMSSGELSPGITKGGALIGGYNASRYVPFADEIWARIYLSFEAGEKDGTRDQFFGAIEVIPEASYYLFGGLASFTGVGFSFAYAGVQVPGATPEADKEMLAGFNLGGVVEAGLDYAVAPEFNLRLTFLYRQGAFKAKLQNEAKTLSLDGGLLSAFHGGFSGIYTF